MDSFSSDVFSFLLEDLLHQQRLSMLPPSTKYMCTDCYLLPLQQFPMLHIRRSFNNAANAHTSLADPLFQCDSTQMRKSRVDLWLKERSCVTAAWYTLSDADCGHRYAWSMITFKCQYFEVTMSSGRRSSAIHIMHEYASSLWVF